MWGLQSVRSPRAARNVSAPRRQPAKGVFLAGNGEDEVASAGELAARVQYLGDSRRQRHDRRAAALHPGRRYVQGSARPAIGGEVVADLAPAQGGPLLAAQRHQQQAAGEIGQHRAGQRCSRIPERCELTHVEQRLGSFTPPDDRRLHLRGLVDQRRGIVRATHVAAAPAEEPAQRRVDTVGLDRPGIGSGRNAAQQRRQLRRLDGADAMRADDRQNVQLEAAALVGERPLAAVADLRVQVLRHRRGDGDAFVARIVAPLDDPQGVVGLAAGVLQCRRRVRAEIDPDPLAAKPCPQPPRLGARGQHTQRQPGNGAVSEVAGNGTGPGSPGRGVCQPLHESSPCGAIVGPKGRLPPDTARCRQAPWSPCKMGYYGRQAVLGRKARKWAVMVRYGCVTSRRGPGRPTGRPRKSPGRTEGCRAGAPAPCRRRSARPARSARRPGSPRRGARRPKRSR